MKNFILAELTAVECYSGPTEISSECADFIALNTACADDIVKSCDEVKFMCQ